MRIVAGKYGSRILKAPQNDAIRPTSDKLRGAIFNILRSRGVLDDAFAMDIFCGTGALGLEALSQGAQHCVFVDSARKSLDLARENAETLKEKNAAFFLKHAEKIGTRAETIAARNLIFLDPPYNKNLINPALEALQKGDWYTPDTFFVIEAEKNYAAPLPAGFTKKEERDYGETLLILATASSR
jgi:16S rRNA (guanine966-N2)-methyltransferase